MGMPVCRSLGKGLWEVRSTLPSNRSARLLFCFHEGAAVVLHGFMKTSQRAPAAALHLARQRMKEVTK